MDQKTVNQMARSAQYQALLEEATRQVSVQPLHQGPLAPVEASFFFPWEYSPHRANGTTSAESNGK